MDAIQAVVLNLRNDSGVDALISNRIYFKYAPNGVDYPLVNVSPVSSLAMNTLDGEVTNTNRERLQIDVWGENYEDVATVAAAVKTAINAESTNFKPVIQDTRHDDDLNNGLVRIILDYALWI